MSRTNGLKNIYESELNRKSKYYEVFDALLRHFRYAEAMICQEAGAVDSHDTGRLLLGNEELYMKYNADMIPFLRSGALYLGYLLGEQKHKAIYDRELRGKRRQMSSVIYNLFREGVDFSDHAAELAAIFNGETVAVSKPFFITTKEMTFVHSRLNTTYGTRLYGAIVTRSKFILLYAPSIEKNLHARIESGLYQSVKNALSYAASPYNLPVNNEYLYMYQSDADIVDSFSEIGKRSAQTASTYRMYVKSLLKDAHIFRMNGSTYRLSDIFDENRKRAIDAAFMEYYEVNPRPRSNLSDSNISGYYRNTDIPVFMVWDLSPSALVSAMEYTWQKGFGINGQVYLLCFEEDANLIGDILNLDRKMAKHFSVCDLPYQEVIRYINGEITHIE